jgi:FdhD protein
MRVPTQSIRHFRYSSDHLEAVDTKVITETAVSLTVNGEIWLDFICTPVELEALAVGFLYNEGLIQGPDDLADVRLCAAGHNVDIWTNQLIKKPGQWRRTSGCTGGFTSVADSPERTRVVDSGVLSAETVCQLIKQLLESQSLYRTTGGVHTSGLADGTDFRIIAEDIGRHNTLDKIAGRYLMDRMDLPRKIIVTTGRISSEMLQKAARLSADVVISRTSPTSLSIEMAERSGITLIGYARGDRFDIYTHPERIVADQVPAGQPAGSASART